MRVLSLVAVLLCSLACQGQGQNILPDSPIPTNVSAWNLESVPIDPIGLDRRLRSELGTGDNLRRFTLQDGQFSYTVTAADGVRDKKVSILIVDSIAHIRLSLLAYHEGSTHVFAEQSFSSNRYQLIMHDPPLGLLAQMILRHGSGLPPEVKRLVENAHARVRAQQNKL